MKKIFIDSALYFAVGFIAMFIVLLICNRLSQKISVWKLIVANIFIFFSGVFGTMLMSFIESGSFLGTSFYGSVFLVPVIMILIAALLRMDYKVTLDFTAPCICIMLAVMKVRCLVSGCCGGIIIGYNKYYAPIYFPSQITEMINALAIFIVLLLLIKSQKHIGMIYPYFMVIYGITRFILNLFRETSPFLWIIPAGNFWSIVSIIIGLSIIIVYKRKKQKIQV